MAAWREVNSTKAAGAGQWIGPHHPCKLQIRGQHMWLKTNIKIDMSCTFKQADTTEPHRRKAQEPVSTDLPEYQGLRSSHRNGGLRWGTWRAASSWFSLAARMSERRKQGYPSRLGIFLHLTCYLGPREAHLTFLKCLQHVFAPFLRPSQLRKNKNVTVEERFVRGRANTHTLFFFWIIQTLNARCVETTTTDGTPFSRQSSQDEMVFYKKLFWIRRKTEIPENLWKFLKINPGKVQAWGSMTDFASFYLMFSSLSCPQSKRMKKKAEGGEVKGGGKKEEK